MSTSASNKLKCYRFYLKRLSLLLLRLSGSCSFRRYILCKLGIKQSNIKIRYWVTKEIKSLDYGMKDAKECFRMVMKKLDAPSDQTDRMG